MSGVHVSTTVNGDVTEFVCQPDETLLDVLRNRLGRTGAKEGCGTGDCGACSVTIDGQLVCSCLVLGAEAEGCKVGTVEGLADGDTLHPLQQQFIEHAANPSDVEIRFALAGNLCRCTGYDKIVRAVNAAAKDVRRQQARQKKARVKQAAKKRR